MPAFTFEVFVVEHDGMKRPAGIPDALERLWESPEPMRVRMVISAPDDFEARLIAAQMGHCNPHFKDPYVVDCIGPM